MLNPGDEQDIYNRLISQLPLNWWGTDHKNLDSILAAFVDTGSFHYQQYLYVVLQTRIKTATDINLDIISSDYLGDELPRRTGETDDSFRTRILATLLREKATRRAMRNALFNLTGFYPRIFEPWNASDCGGYNVSEKMGYNIAGSYGSGSFAYQAFIDVYVDPYQGMSRYSGYNSYFGGYNAAGGLADFWYGGQSLQQTIISDSDIYKLINLTKVFGTVIWTKIIRGKP
jgi:hypothetical protein